MKKEKAEHKNYIDMEVYLADIKRYRETAETQKMLLDKLVKENKKLKEDVDYFRQCYLDLKKLCEKEWFMLSDEEVTKMFNLDKIK